MKSLLQINASIFADGSQSTRLADRFVAGWAAHHPGASVTVRDLGREPVPHLTAEGFGGFLAKPEDRSAAQQDLVAFSDRLIDEVRRADILVLGLPMYNFGVPSALKAYFDHIARSGVTFRYTETGPVGLLTGKRAVVAATRGGLYAGTAKDSQTTYVRDFLRFLGIENVHFIYAEGLGMGDERKESALRGAHESIAQLTTAAAVAA
jgi:FMN-dependent NADH-azoreductase